LDSAEQRRGFLPNEGELAAELNEIGITADISYVQRAEERGIFDGEFAFEPHSNEFYRIIAATVKFIDSSTDGGTN
jgi:hypothetical protein